MSYRRPAGTEWTPHKSCSLSLDLVNNVRVSLHQEKINFSVQRENITLPSPPNLKRWAKLLYGTFSGLLNGRMYLFEWPQYYLVNVRIQLRILETWNSRWQLQQKGVSSHQSLHWIMHCWQALRPPMKRFHQHWTWLRRASSVNWHLNESKFLKGSQAYLTHIKVLT